MRGLALIPKEFVMINDMDFKMELLREMFNLGKDGDCSDILKSIKKVTGFTNDEMAMVLGYSSGVRISEFINRKQKPSNQGMTAVFFWCLLNVETIAHQTDVELTLHDFRDIPQS